jgi:predicted oxidoreductase
MSVDAEVIIVGAGLSGLVAAAEIADAGRRVIVLDQEPEASLGGQAFWSFGGLFLVDTPEQRRLGIHDSAALALQDWMGSAAFDRAEDRWPRAWAEAYVDFAAGEKRSWLHRMGVRFFPVVQWAERGGYLATGHGNSVPRFHVTWGTGPGVLQPFVTRVRAAAEKGLVTLRFRHRVTELLTTAGAVSGVRGEILEESAAARGAPSSRSVVGEFTLRSAAVIIASGGIGGNHAQVRESWPAGIGVPRQEMLCGVPDHVDGLMMETARRVGAHRINSDRMWHYPEGIGNYAPVWTRHGIRILSGPSPLWLDARGNRLPSPLFPGFDSLGALAHIVATGHGHSWFVLNQRILRKEIALSGSEQNPDLTSRSILMTLGRALPGTPGPVAAFQEHGADFVTRRTIAELARGMNDLTAAALIDPAALEAVVRARDRQLDNPFAKDAQVTAIRGARAYLADRLVRVARPHRILDPAAGPLIAVRLRILTRKTLGGLETDLGGRVLRGDGRPLAGLYAAGEAAGFGGGGMHGYRALEGTFLGGCLFSGRVAGRAAAAEASERA